MNLKMKLSAIVCAVLAGSLGFGTVASAQEWGHRGGGEQHRGAAPPARPRAFAAPQMQQRAFAAPPMQQRAFAAPQVQQRAWAGPRYEAPRYYGYNHPHFYRGGFLPYAYRQPAFCVSDWNAYGLYAPPYGYQWVQVGDDFLLVALATGLIANLIAMQ